MFLSALIQPMPISYQFAYRILAGASKQRTQTRVHYNARMVKRHVNSRITIARLQDQTFAYEYQRDQKSWLEREQKTTKNKLSFEDPTESTLQQDLMYDKMILLHWCLGICNILGCMPVCLCLTLHVPHKHSKHSKHTIAEQHMWYLLISFVCLS